MANFKFWYILKDVWWWIIFHLYGWIAPVYSAFVFISFECAHSIIDPDNNAICICLWLWLHIKIDRKIESPFVAYAMQCAQKYLFTWKKTNVSHVRWWRVSGRKIWWRDKICGHSAVFFLSLSAFEHLKLMALEWKRSTVTIGKRSTVNSANSEKKPCRPCIKNKCIC